MRQQRQKIVTYGPLLCLLRPIFLYPDTCQLLEVAPEMTVIATTLAVVDRISMRIRILYMDGANNFWD